MKRFLLLLLIVISYPGISQPTTWCTPQGSISTITYPQEATLTYRQEKDSIEQTKTYWATDNEILYLKDGDLASSSDKYACYDYALYVQFDKDNPGQISANYWEDDGSLISYNPTIKTPQKGDILIYKEGGDRSHVAVIESVKNGEVEYLISKWDVGPLVKHKIQNCPYDNPNTTYEYYELADTSTATISITGSSRVCNSSNVTFTAITDLKNVSYSWDVGSKLSGSSTTKSITVNPATTSTNGKQRITVTVNLCGGGAITAYKDVWVGKPLSSDIDIDVATYDELLACDLTTADVEGSSNQYISGITAYEWDIPYSSDWYIDDDGGPIDMEYVEIDYYEDPPPSTETIKVRAQNSCGWSSWKSKTVDVIDNCGGYFMMTMSPNPANDVVSLDIVPDDEQVSEQNAVKLDKVKKEKLKNGEFPEYTIEIHHMNKGLRRKMKSRDKHLQINTLNLEPGFYFILMNIEGKIYKQTLIIER